MDHYSRPLATLSNRKMELDIKDLPARLGRNSSVVEIYLFDESVSREHCAFECINHRIAVMDLGSTAGTYINGVRLEPNIPYNIEDGAKICFGTVELEFHADSQALSEWENGQGQAQSAPVEAPVIELEEPAAREEAPASAPVVAEEEPASTPEEIEESIAKEEDPVDWKHTQVLGIDDVDGDLFTDEHTFKDDDTLELPELPKTLHLTWIDDISGETKTLKIDHYPFAIGRKSDVNDYTIAKKGVSRKHMRFEEADGEVYLYDDASTNGVRLNGKRIEPETLVKLSDGDKIRVLDITFAVTID